MLSHLSLGVADLARATAFYDAVMATLGNTRVFTGPVSVGYGGRDGLEKLALKRQPAGAPYPGPGFHLAFEAASHAAVDRFHEAALAQGAADAGGPRLRPHYGPTYYAAFVIDLDGHKLEAVCQ